MKVMSFNTQHCNNFLTNTIDFDVMAQAILTCDADIVGLNEMRGTGSHPDYTAQTEKLAQLTGMPYMHFAPAIHFAAGPYGNAFLSKIPIVKTQTIMIPDPVHTPLYETRCIFKAELEGGITVLVTHMGLGTEEQQNAVDTLLKIIPDRKCILMGDFNMTPDNPTLQPLFRKMTDTAQCFDMPKRSFPSDVPKLKLDYILVSRDITVVSADIPAIIASDHRPHTATIQV